jgi:hypothetical protein
MAAFTTVATTPLQNLIDALSSSIATFNPETNKGVCIIASRVLDGLKSNDHCRPNDVVAAGGGINGEGGITISKGLDYVIHNVNHEATSSFLSSAVRTWKIGFEEVEILSTNVHTVYLCLFVLHGCMKKYIFEIFNQITF